MKLILFFGHHKVGSSALQTFLSRNAIAFLRRGILYPAVESQGLTTLLDIALSGADRSEASLPVNFREAHNALAFGMMAAFAPGKHQVPALHQGLPSVAEMTHTIRQQIDILNPHTIMLASEVMANFGGSTPKLIDRLGRIFAGTEMHLTATLRRVDDYMVSWHAQRLRFGDKPRSLPGGAFDHYRGGIHFDYRRMIEPWLERLPGATLGLRSYDEVIAAGGAVPDFLTGNGIDFAEVENAGRQVNTGLHRAVIEIARKANHALSEDDAHETFRALLDLGPELGLPPARDIEMFGPGIRREILAQFTPIADWLAATAGRPLFPDLEDIARPRPVHEHAANRVALDAIRREHLAAFPPAARDFLTNLVLEPNFPVN